MNLRNYYEVYDEIVHRYTTGYLDVLPSTLRNKVSPDSFKARVKVSLIWFLRDLINPFRVLLVKISGKDRKMKKGLLWVFVSSINQLNSTKFLLSEFPDAIRVVPHIRNPEFTDYILPYYFKLIFYFKLPLLFYAFYKYNRHFLINHFHFLVEAIGTYEVSKSMIRLRRPSGVVFSNDHIFKHRALMIACRHEKVKTFFIQHATSSIFFPPLKYNVSFLEGLDSLDKYKKCGKVDGEVLLVGMPKFSKYASFRRKTVSKIEKIGIATNTFDEVEKIEELLAFLDSRYKLIDLIYRPHPKDARAIVRPERFKISNASSQNSFEFIQHVDLLIAGDSSIHIESQLLHIPTVMYNFSKYSPYAKDLYGYCKNGLVKVCNSVNELPEFIENPESLIDTNAVKYYNTSYGTKEELETEKIITRKILESLSS